MRRSVICFLLILLLGLAACQRAEPQPQGGEFLFYYPRGEISYSGGSVLCTQSVSIDPNTIEPEALVRQYLSAEIPEGAAPAIPDSWTLYEVSLDADTVNLRFAGSSAGQAEATVSCVCLAKTLLQLPTIRSVSILTPESRDATVLTANDILLEDTGMLPQEEQVVLYFPDAQRRYLIAQTASISQEESSNKPAFVLNQLLSQTESSCIPQGTRLLSVSVENGICTVDLSSEFTQNMEPSFAFERMAVYSIVNSLTELPEISTVDIWVAGAPLEQLYLMDLSQGVARDEGVLSTALSGERMDISLYPAIGSGSLLAEIPLIIEPEDDGSTAELAVNALINYEGGNGLRSCIPSGTKLLSVRMEGSTCVLDFTGEFIGGCSSGEEEALAVRSVIATVCALPEISAVEILVEGIEPSYRDPSLELLRRPEAHWIAD